MIDRRRKWPESLWAKLRVCPVVTLMAGVSYALQIWFVSQNIFKYSHWQTNILKYMATKIIEISSNMLPLPPPSTAHYCHPSPREQRVRTCRQRSRQGGPSCAPVFHTWEESVRRLFVPEPDSLHLCNVCEARGGGLDQLLLNVKSRLVKQCLGLKKMFNWGPSMSQCLFAREERMKDISYLLIPLSTP